MITLSDRWAPKLLAQGETGMGYQVASVILKDGRRFDQAVIVGGYLTQIKGIKDISFAEEEIQDIVVTHDKWDFNAEG
jgi:hypothetical protein